mmetsp:Transcript_14903/g.39937  ORF Transcript_14903/g.39937 Transcript_14903/m.39937 type:complete len:280 (+) Transcript_14903:4166-5005(+)
MRTKLDDGDVGVKLVRCGLLKSGQLRLQHRRRHKVRCVARSCSRALQQHLFRRGKQHKLQRDSAASASVAGIEAVKVVRARRFAQPIAVRLAQRAAREHRAETRRLKVLALAMRLTFRCTSTFGDAVFDVLRACGSRFECGPSGGVCGSTERFAARIQPRRAVLFRERDARRHLCAACLCVIIVGCDVDHAHCRWERSAFSRIPVFAASDAVPSSICSGDMSASHTQHGQRQQARQTAKLPSASVWLVAMPCAAESTARYRQCRSRGRIASRRNNLEII